MIRRISLTRFSHFIIGYMVLAFGWWSYHLWCQNDRLYAVEKQLLAVSPAQQAAPEAGVRLTKQWQSRRRMVVAEGLFFYPLPRDWAVYHQPKRQPGRGIGPTAAQFYAEHHPRAEIADCRHALGAGNPREARTCPRTA